MFCFWAGLVCKVGRHLLCECLINPSDNGDPGGGWRLRSYALVPSCMGSRGDFLFPAFPPSGQPTCLKAPWWHLLGSPHVSTLSFLWVLFLTFIGHLLISIWIIFPFPSLEGCGGDASVIYTPPSLPFPLWKYPQLPHKRQETQLFLKFISRLVTHWMAAVTSVTFLWSRASRTLIPFRRIRNPQRVGRVPSCEVEIWLLQKGLCEAHRPFR